METPPHERSWLDQNLGTVLIIIFLIGVSSIAAVVGFYRYHFSAPLLVRNDVWGQFGDFVGGQPDLC